MCVKKVDFNICLAIKYSVLVDTDTTFFPQASCLKLQNFVLEEFHTSKYLPLVHKSSYFISQQLIPLL